MSDLTLGSGGAEGALRLGAAMRERAFASAALAALRAAVVEAEARLDAAQRLVDSLGSEVSFEQLLDLVATLSARVAELESGMRGEVSGEPPAHAGAPSVTAAPPFVEGVGRAPAELLGPVDAVQAVSPPPALAPALAPASAPAPAPAAPPAPAPAEPEEDLTEGRRGPNRALLFMEGYEAGYFEAQEGKPDSSTATRGWGVKGHRAGRADALGRLEFNPLDAFFQEMREFAPREPLTAGQRQEAARIAARVALTRSGRSAGKALQAAPDVDARDAIGGDHDVGAEASEWDGAAPSSGGDDPDDEELQVPGFLSRS